MYNSPNPYTNPQFCSNPTPMMPGFQPDPTQEIAQEQGYPPPDPSFYDFYAGDPMMQQFIQPQPQRPQYIFQKRINKMNWDLIGRYDVGNIARTGDIASIEQLMHPIAFANITQDDAEQFGSRGSLHAFLILQMAVELMLQKLSTIPPTTPNQNPMAPPTPQQHTPQIIAQYEAQVNLLKKDIKSRDTIINNLTDKLQQAEIEKQEALAAVQSLKGKLARKTSNQLEESPAKVQKSPKLIPETNTMHLDTEYQDYIAERPKIKRSARHKSHRRPPPPSDTSSSDWV